MVMSYIKGTKYLDASNTLISLTLPVLSNRFNFSNFMVMQDDFMMIAKMLTQRGTTNIYYLNE